MVPIFDVDNTFEPGDSLIFEKPWMARGKTGLFMIAEENDIALVLSTTKERAGKAYVLLKGNIFDIPCWWLESCTRKYS